MTPRTAAEAEAAALDAPCEHRWTAATSYQIAHGIPGSVCGKCGAIPAFLEDGRSAALDAPDDIRPVWKRDHGMVLVTSKGDEEPQSLEIPAWAVRAIYAQAGKDPEQEAAEINRFIRAGDRSPASTRSARGRSMREWARRHYDALLILAFFLSGTSVVLKLLGY